MAEVHADPEKLRQLAKTLAASAAKLDDVARQSRRGLDATGWSDRERQRFEGAFNQTLKAISAAAAQLRDQHAKDLEKKAAALERFHG